MTEWVRLCGLDELAEDQMFKVEVLGCDYLVVKLGDDVSVTDASCTHEWADLTEGRLEGDIVTCPQCEGQFNVRSGEVIREPPTFPLDTYSVKIEDQTVYSDVTGY